MLGTWIADAHYSVRRLWSHPGYALLAVLTLALGVGGTASTYGDRPGAAGRVAALGTDRARPRAGCGGDLWRDCTLRGAPPARLGDSRRVWVSRFARDYSCGGPRRVATAGIGVGVVGAAALTRLLSSFLYGMSVIDPIAFGAAAAALLGVGTLAAFVRAWRAGMTDPVIALREQ